MNTKEINGYPIPELEEMNRLFPEYSVEMLVGIGSSGAVFYAHKDGKMYSIKLVIGPRNVRTECEFKAEADAMRAMEHPSIVKMYDCGEVESYRYIVMDYVERGTLHGVMQEFKFNEKSIANMSILICDGLAHAHEKGFIHRDIKPDNIMIAEDWTPRIMDFGLAINLNDPQYGATAVGSRGYAAPEVSSDPKSVDHLVDVYAMGGLIYTMLTSKIPDPNEPDLNNLKGHDIRFKIIIKNAMEQDRAKRTQSVIEIKDKLLNMKKSWELLS